MLKQFAFMSFNDALRFVWYVLQFLAVNYKIK